MKKRETIVLYKMGFTKNGAVPEAVDVYVNRDSQYVIVENDGVEFEWPKEDLFVDYDYCNEKCDDYNDGE